MRAPIVDAPVVPLVDGAEATAAWAAIDAIAVALGEPRGAGDATLARGAAGHALFFAYLAAARLGHGDEERAVAWLEHAFDGEIRVRAARVVIRNDAKRRPIGHLEKPATDGK